MYKSYKILAVSGARSGSQGLRDKNIHSCAGKPLINWTIEAAKNSKYIDKLIVSTDSEAYAKIAIDAGAEVPFLRPAEISSGEAPIGDFLTHTVSQLHQMGEDFDFIISLPPTSPLRTSKHIDEAIDLFFTRMKSNKDQLVSVYRAPEKMGWLMQARDEQYINFCFPISNNSIQRQKLQKYYLPNGAIKITATNNISGDFYSDYTQFYEMSFATSFDIDTIEDLLEAEKALTQNSNEK